MILLDPFSPNAKIVSIEMTKVLLFSGHMIDKPKRKDVRFPPKMEAAVARSIAEAISTLRPSLGIASGAGGGDILFHEACFALVFPPISSYPLSPRLLKRNRSPEQRVGTGSDGFV
jgi:hypothetical protein